LIRGQLSHAFAVQTIYVRVALQMSPRAVARHHTPAPAVLSTIPQIARAMAGFDGLRRLFEGLLAEPAQAEQAPAVTGRWRVLNRERRTKRKLKRQAAATQILGEIHNTCVAVHTGHKLRGQGKGKPCKGSLNMV